LYVVKLIFCLAFAALLRGQAPASAGWRALFDGKTLAHWKDSDFFGAGKVTIEEGSITLGFGALTGVTWADPSLPFPTAGYELRLDAMRVKGSDFFAGITFPVRDSYCTWIVGGWGGEVVGLSSIDHNDAAHNETSFNQKFDLGRWYALRVRVVPDRISAWIDGDLVIDIPIANRIISLREGEIEHSVPFGIASYETISRLKNIEWRPVSAPK
jgi:hypothetical protein